jgi:putative thioredoxin
MEETIIEVTDQNFKEKILEKSKEIPVVVDFWAEWCPPCKMLGPVLEKLAKEYKGKFILAKVNVDQANQASNKYGIRSIPSVKMFKDEKIIDDFVGAIPEETIKQWLNKNLK